MLVKELAWAFASSLSVNSFVIILLANGCTLACFYTETSYPMRLDLIGIAVVFPLVFSINGAFQRREQALQHLARMKANAYSIRYSFHHWMEGAFLRTSGPKEIDKVLHHTFGLIANYFKSEDFLEVDYMKIVSKFAEISWLIEVHLRKGGVPPPNISRVCESLRTLISEFELLRNIKIYRTPLALRAYTKIFVLIFPVLFAPLFAALALEFGLWGALILTTLFSCILAGLDNIQDGLEEPFDGLGIDDIHFDQYIRHMRLPATTPSHREYDFDFSMDDCDLDNEHAIVLFKNYDESEESTEVKVYCDEEEYLVADISSRRGSRHGAPMMNRK